MGKRLGRSVVLPDDILHGLLARNVLFGTFEPDVSYLYSRGLKKRALFQPYRMNEYRTSPKGMKKGSRLQFTLFFLKRHHPPGSISEISVSGTFSPAAAATPILKTGHSSAVVWG